MKINHHFLGFFRGDKLNLCQYFGNPLLPILLRFASESERNLVSVLVLAYYSKGEYALKIFLLWVLNGDHLRD